MHPRKLPLAPVRMPSENGPTEWPKPRQEGRRSSRSGGVAPWQGVKCGGTVRYPLLFAAPSVLEGYVNASNKEDDGKGKADHADYPCLLNAALL